MSWFRVDDKLHGSVKRLKVSTAAMGLWVCAGSWSRDKKTGGYIPKEALAALAPDLSPEQRLALADELVEAHVDGIHEHGLWLPMPNGWQFNDWEDHYGDDELGDEARERLSRIRAEAGRRGALARWSKAEWQSDSKNGFAMFANGSPDPRARHAHATREDPSSGSDPVLCLEDPDSSGSGSSALSSQPKDLTGNARVSGDSAQADDAQASKKSPFRSDDEREVFAYWATKLWPLVHGQKRAPRATGPRLSRIRARLRDGYTAADLKRAIDGVAQSKWHLGENDSGKAYIEPETIFRNAEKVDVWLSTRAAKAPGLEQHEKTLSEADQHLLEAIKRGEYGVKARELARSGKLNLERWKRWRREQNQKGMANV